MASDSSVSNDRLAVSSNNLALSLSLRPTLESAVESLHLSSSTCKAPRHATVSHKLGYFHGMDADTKPERRLRAQVRLHAASSR